MTINYETDRNWQPLEEGVVPPTSQELVELAAREMGITTDEARQRIDAYNEGTSYWINNLYQVQLRPFEAHGMKWVHLNIRRRDGKAIMRDWRHFQWIKNQLVGPECEAIELYPAESRMVDSNNKYHLWCAIDPAFRFPLGMQDRDVDYTQRAAATNGTRQRPLNK